MIHLRRAGQRHRLDSGGQTLWLSFSPALREDRLGNGFGGLTSLNEGRLPPEGTLLTYSRRGSEMVTYVIEGTLAHRGSGSGSSLIRAGDFQRSSVPHGDHVSYANASGSDPLHVMQFSLAGDRIRRRRTAEQKSFPVHERSAALCLVGSQDGRHGSLVLDQDVLLYSCVLDAGHSILHTLGDTRMAWLQVVRGEVELEGTPLLPGDGAGIRFASSFGLSAQQAAEVVILDLGAQTLHPAIELDGRARGSQAPARASVAA